MALPNYWGFRINWRNKEAKAMILEELQSGTLRQGWGWTIEQKLPECKVDKGAKRNRPIYYKVKKGDFLFIPHLPSYEQVTIVQAAEDFKTGYRFEISSLGDYGHCFPINKDYKKTFVRVNSHVDADIKSTLRTPMRFWSMNECAEKIKTILDTPDNELHDAIQYENAINDILDSAITEALDCDVLKANLRRQFEHYFQASEWEFALRKVFEIIMPHCIVKRVGGRSEKQHGCDLALFVPALEFDKKYVIAIQIKDYEGVVGTHPVDQVKKSDTYWTGDSKFKVIDKYVIVINARKENNANLEQYANANNVRVLYSDDVLELLSRAAKIKGFNINY